MAYSNSRVGVGGSLVGGSITSTACQGSGRGQSSRARLKEAPSDQWLSRWMQRTALLFEVLPERLVETACVYSGADRQAYIATLEAFYVFFVQLASGRTRDGLMSFGSSLESDPHSLVNEVEQNIRNFLMRNAALLRHVQRANLEPHAHPSSLVTNIEAVQLIHDLLLDLFDGTATRGDGGRAEVGLVHDLFIRYAWRTLQSRQCPTQPSPSSSLLNSAWAMLGYQDQDRMRDLYLVLRELIVHDTLYGSQRMFHGAIEIEGFTERQAFRFPTNDESSEPPNSDVEMNEASPAAQPKPLFLNDFICRFMPKDGNCQFHSVADQLNLTTERLVELYDAAMVRKDVVYWLLKAGPRIHSPNGQVIDLREYAYLPTMTEDQDLDKRWDAYLEHMSCEGSWGDNLTLQAAAQVYQRRITVMDWSGVMSNVEPWNNHLGSLKESETLFLFFYMENHYDSLEKRRKPVISPPPGHLNRDGVQEKWKWEVEEDKAIKFQADGISFSGPKLYELTMTSGKSCALSGAQL